VKHFAVIPTHNRPDDLYMLLRTIPPYVDVLVIDNASTPPVMLNQDIVGLNVQVHRDEEQPPNLSRLWNVGLAWAQNTQRGAQAPEETDEWAVTILNDDVVLPGGFFELMGDELLTHDVDIAFPGSVGLRCYLNWDNAFPGVGLRLTGWCFTVRGSSGLRADESLRWWCGDDDLQAQAVTHGRGTVAVLLPKNMAAALRHKHPDESTNASPELRAQTALDMTTFVKKWGQRPW